MSFAIRNFEKFIFVSKNQLYDPRVGCKDAFNLVEFIEREENLEEELKEFEKECQREKIENCE